MTEPKQCQSCLWWYRFTEDDDIFWGKCVWHTGTQKTTAMQVKIKGSIETRRDFGCIKHEEDRRA